MSYTFRALETQEELERVEHLQAQVWSMEDRSIVPFQMMMVIQYCGGLISGAFAGDDMVGFTLALPARHSSGDWRLWSHMAAVRHDYRKRGVGFGLKSHQRRWALQQGYDTIAWTFDPLQRVNANFNLRRLGAVGIHYWENRYGEMRDGINQGMPSDRLEVSWRLSSARVVDHADGDPMPVLVETKDDRFILRVGEALQPIVNAPDKLSELCYFVEIPPDIAAVRDRPNGDALIMAWRAAHRQIFTAAFAHGYEAVDFVNSDTRCWYVLYRVR